MRSLHIAFIAALAMLIGAPVIAQKSPPKGPPAQQGRPDEISKMRQEFAKLDHPGRTREHAEPPRAPRMRNLSRIGFHDLGGGGFNSDVWAHGQFAYVGTWGLFTGTGEFCPAGGTRVVDISDPATPTVVDTISTSFGTQTNDVKVARVNTKHFKGDLLVVSNEDCRPGGARGFELWDVTDPADAEFLGRFGPQEAFDTEPFLVDIGFGVHNVFIFEKKERVYVAAVVDFGEHFQLLFGASLVGDLRIVDVTDPTKPKQVADWGIATNLGLDPFAGQGDDFAFSFLHDVWWDEDVLYLSYWDAGLILLDARNPENLRFISRTPYAAAEEGNTHVAVPAQGSNLVIVGDEDFTPGPWGFMRVFDTLDPSAPVEIGTFATDNVDTPASEGDFSIHNVIVRGESVYVSYYSDGIRVVDISQPAAPREIAAFVPEAVEDPFGVLPTAPELWGIYVQGELILGSDMNSGLHILKHVP